ncbi:pyrimidine 5'-nucleotidase [soil metagenome]
MIKAICFDLDGTLAHYQGDFRALGRAVFQTLAVPTDHFETASAAFSKHVRSEGVSTLPIILRGIAQDLGSTSINTRHLKLAADTMTADYAAEMALLPGAKEVLELVQHLPLALVSNGPSDMQRAALRKMGLESFFTAIVISGDEDVAVRKPNPRIFELACERLNAPPEHVLMVGDNLEADIRGALAAGLQAVWLGEDEVEGVETVGSPKELHAYLRAKTFVN